MTAAPQMSPPFSRQVQDFFCQRLLAQRNASPRTIASYRDAFGLLLRFTQTHLGKNPSELALGDLDAPVVLAFLDYLERDRHNTIRSRNARLAALRSFFQYAASRDPANLPTIQRVLAIPRKREDQPLLGFLSREEMAALQDAPDLTTRSGRRDQVLIATLYNTGARVSEAIELRVSDFVGGRTAFVKLQRQGAQRAHRSLVEEHRSTADGLGGPPCGIAGRPPFPESQRRPNDPLRHNLPAFSAWRN